VRGEGRSSSDAPACAGGWRQAAEAGPSSGSAAPPSPWPPRLRCRAMRAYLGRAEGQLPTREPRPSRPIRARIPQAHLEPAVAAADAGEDRLAVELEQAARRRKGPAAGGRCMDEREREPLPSTKQLLGRGARAEGQGKRGGPDHLGLGRWGAGARGPRPGGDRGSADRSDAAKEREAKLAVRDLVLEHALVVGGHTPRRDEVPRRPRGRRRLE